MEIEIVFDGSAARAAFDGARGVVGGALHTERIANAAGSSLRSVGLSSALVVALVALAVLAAAAAVAVAAEHPTSPTRSACC